ncbi:MAG: ATPase, T2SS/T4P/T4SS family [Planctomycetota bacterium]
MTDDAKDLADLDAPGGVVWLLGEAQRRRASDVHLEPIPDGIEVRLRVDGVLDGVCVVPAATGRGLVNRWMVLAGLLTYRLDVPQEGRGEIGGIEVRVSVMPTNHGLRAVVRLPAEALGTAEIDDLRLPEPVRDGLCRFADGEASSAGGMLILCGPAGSGKTTATYAVLQRLVRSGGLSVVSLEDPIERDVPGVTQVEVRPFGELTYERALRSLLRQDPQVLALGEVRDAATAKVAVEAALSGHRLITTLHAGSVTGALMRLLEMGVPAYQLAAAVSGVAALRLVRKRAGEGRPETYSGRAAVGSFAAMDAALRTAIVDGQRGDQLEAVLREQSSYETLEGSAMGLIDVGLTDVAEVSRALGAVGLKHDQDHAAVNHNGVSAVTSGKETR